MQVMSDAAKKRIYEVVETLPATKLRAAQMLLEELRDDDSGADELDDAEAEALHATIERGLEQMRAGLGRPANEIIAKLRQRR
ncbi:MAG: hypothetical protein AAB426_12485 [Myxococcota bacterium]